ncbi:hypothetical protein OUZ56_009329 [Daphnia magna]|uniref:Uncharacterized protein n=1 Tax=Daphnia magna TaxID=35525 RepID=A0ABR0AFN6_9CRUS|nr:hypothetical protein OUZ56_009329 [Daphnia magna]
MWKTMLRAIVQQRTTNCTKSVDLLFVNLTLHNNIGKQKSTFTRVILNEVLSAKERDKVWPSVVGGGWCTLLASARDEGGWARSSVGGLSSNNIQRVLSHTQPDVDYELPSNSSYAVSEKEGNWG